MPFIVNAKVKCDLNGCPNVTQADLVRDEHTGVLLLPDVIPTAGWKMRRDRGRNLVHCPDHAQ